MFFKTLDKYLLKEYFFPFIISIITITFLFSIDFIVKILDSILKKGLDAGIVFQYFFLNLAWILALSVPMAALLSSLMVFGRLSNDNEIIAVTSMGINPIRIMRAPIIASIFISILMIFYQDNILSEANHKAAELGSAIKRAKPASMIIENFIISEIPGYKIIVSKIDYDNNLMKNVKIFEEKTKSTIYSKSGKILIQKDKMFLILFDGGIIQEQIDKNKNINISRLIFKKHIMSLELPSTFKKIKRNYRSDREMDIKMMKKKVANYKIELSKKEKQYYKFLVKNISFASDSLYVQDKKRRTNFFKKDNNQHNLSILLNRINTNLSKNKQFSNNIINSKKSISKYLVEIYKKYSLSFACLIFILIGIPLGTIVRTGGMGVAIGSGFIIFVMYWAYLITGERMADSLTISPFIAMWGFNFILLIFGIYLLYLITYQNINIKINFSFLKKIIKKYAKQ